MAVHNTIRRTVIWSLAALCGLVMPAHLPSDGAGLLRHFAPLQERMPVEGEGVAHGTPVEGESEGSEHQPPTVARRALRSKWRSERRSGVHSLMDLSWSSGSLGRCSRSLVNRDRAAEPLPLSAKDLCVRLQTWRC